jgi:Mn-dependent DtxR family transcriptional regulator
MSLTPKKIEILETLLVQDKPTRSKKIAEEMNNDFPEIQMHLVGLTKKGYTRSPEKAYYAITEEGKKALGLPEVDKQKAKAIMDCVPASKAFHFYLGISKPLSTHAHSLTEFANEVAKIDTQCIEFHISRGDFGAWFSSIGDQELARKMELLKRKNLTGEDLRNRVHEITQTRCTTLAKLLEQ